MRRSVVTVVLGAGLAAAFAPAVAVAADPPILVHADDIVPKQRPAAPIAHWIAAPGRTTFSLEVPGGTLRGFRYAASGRAPAPVLLFFNGNGQTVDAQDADYRKLAALGVNVVVTDYRGYGFSSGTPSVATWNADALLLYDALAKEGPVAVQGFSFGTCVAAHVAAERRVAATILDAPYATALEELQVVTRLQGMQPEMIARLQPADDARLAFDETALVARSTAPLLIVHGTADVEVPIAQGREVLAASAASRKQFVEVPGAGHADLTTMPAALDAERAFLAGIAAR